MKKIIITLAAMAIAVSSFAQASIGAGYLNQSKTNESIDPQNGFYVGADYNINLAGALGVAPGIYYNYAAWKNGNSTANVSLKEHYISVPVMFNYSINLASVAKLFVYAGPTARFGLSSKSTGSISFIGSATGDNYDDTGYNRANVLIGGGIGIDFVEKLRLSVGYDYGLINRFKDSSTKYNDKLFHVGLAFLF